MILRHPNFRILLLGSALLALTACNRQFDWDLRNTGGGLNTAQAARQAATTRPQPDARGVISYPNYQVAIARRGDTVQTVADRVGIASADLARFNAVRPNDLLREGEVMALPRRVAEPSVATGARPPAAGGLDIGSIATTAIDRADAGAPAAAAKAPSGTEPLRHKVVRGETAYSIARLYNVSTKALAEWNGLDANLSVREGQYLMIPVMTADRAPAASNTAPGQGSPTPTPPSASKPLPAENTAVAGAKPTGTPGSPDLGTQRSAASSARFVMPADGKIIRGYVPKKNDGIDIAANAGSPVKAAADGTVAAITQDTEQVPIIVIRHADELLTVYANIEGIKVTKGATVKRGQTIAAVRASNPAFLRFEVRKGFETLDPMTYLQ